MTIVYFVFFYFITRDQIIFLIKKSKTHTTNCYLSSSQVIIILILYSSLLVDHAANHFKCCVDPNLPNVGQSNNRFSTQVRFINLLEIQDSFLNV